MTHIWVLLEKQEHDFWGAVSPLTLSRQAKETMSPEKKVVKGPCHAGKSPSGASLCIPWQHWISASAHQGYSALIDPASLHWRSPSYQNQRSRNVHRCIIPDTRPGASGFPFLNLKQRVSWREDSEPWCPNTFIVQPKVGSAEQWATGLPDLRRLEQILFVSFSSFNVFVLELAGGTLSVLLPASHIS